MTKAPDPTPLSTAKQAWFRPLLRVLLICYGLFFAGYFLVPKAFEGLHYKFFYVVILLLSLPLLPGGFRRLRTDPIFLLLLGYLLYMLASVTWSDAFHEPPVPWRDIYQYGKHALHLVVFIITAGLLLRHLPRAYQQMRFTVFFMAAASALLGMLLWYSDNPFPESRLEGFSLARNANDLAFVYGAVCIWGVGCLLSGGTRYLRLASLPALTLLSAAILFSQSRGTLLALACALAIFALHRVDRKAIVLVGAFLAIVLLTIGMAEPDIIENMLTRGGTFRGTLWTQTLDNALEHYLVGAGYLSDPYFEVEGILFNAHNAYLATFRDGGLVGLGLLSAVLFLACRRAYREGRQSGDYTWLVALVFGMACLITSGDRLIDRPKELWLFFWLPVAMVVAMGPASQRANSP